MNQLFEEFDRLESTENHFNDDDKDCSSKDN